MIRQVKAKLVSFLTVTLVVVVSAFAQNPDGVSPGAADRTALIEGRCPTFIWDSVPGAAFHELVGYRLPDNPELADPAAIDLADADQVLYAKVPGSAPAWEPELAECLAPGGNYVWFVRAVLSEEEGEVVEASEWSYGKYFSISSMPSAGKVEEALRVLRRHSEQQIDPMGLATERIDTNSATPSGRVEIPQPAPKSVTSAKTAIKGTVPDATGETYGVVGVSNSPDGAGVAAANTNGGPDLVLDGSADFSPDTELSQSGFDRPWASPQTFNIQNSVGAGMTLQVDGVEVVTAATDQDTVGALSCASGEVAKFNGSAWNCAPDDDTTYSAGYGLDLVGTTFSLDPTKFNGATPAASSSGSATIPASTAFTTLRSVTISTEGTGFVLLVGTSACYTNDLDAANDFANLYVGLDTDASGTPSFLNRMYLEWYGSAAGGYSRELDAISTTGVFPVTSDGSHTYYYRGSTNSIDEEATCWTNNLSAIFVPN